MLLEGDDSVRCDLKCILRRGGLRDKHVFSKTHKDEKKRKFVKLLLLLHISVMCKLTEESY